MSSFFILFLIAFCGFFGFAWLLILCRRRVGRTRHGLTGMCHSSGGTMCSSCSEKLQAPDRGSGSPAAAGYPEIPTSENSELP